MGWRRRLGSLAGSRPSRMANGSSHPRCVPVDRIAPLCLFALTCECSPREASCPPLQVRQSTESRQAHAEQWARRSATDRALSKSKAEKVARAESEGRSTSKGHEVYSRAHMIQSKISLELEVWGPKRIGLCWPPNASDGL